MRFTPNPVYRFLSDTKSSMMKLRSATLAICLGCFLSFAPTVIALWSGTQPFSWSSTQDEQPVVLQTSIPNATPGATPGATLSATPGATPSATVVLSTTPVILANAKVTNAQSEPTDLLITKSSSPAIVKAGDPLTYTIVVTNIGTVAAQNLAIYDELPAGVHFQGESKLTATNGAYSQLQIGAHTLTGTVGLLEPSGRVFITGRTVVETSATGTMLQNTVYMTSTNDSTPDNNQASVDTLLITATPTATPLPTATQTATPMPTSTTANTLPPSATSSATPTATPIATATATALPDLANLGISKSVAPAPIQVGAILTYTIRVNNPGPGQAQNVVIRDILPNGLLFEGPSSLSVVRGEEPQLFLSTVSLTGTVRLLKVGGIITITAPARVHPNIVSGMLTNKATVTSTTPDDQPANNQTVTPVVLFLVPPYRSYLPAILQ